MRSFVWAATTMLAAPAAWAEAPKVVTDIAPVHSLVAQVMQGVGTPVMLIDPGASPHGYALRPSQARALSQADVVFWIGEALTPWMEQPLEALAADAHSVELLELEATLQLEFREGATFEGHDHDEPHGEDHDAHGHEEHADDDHDDHDEHNEHGHDDHDEHGHDDHEEHGHDDHEEHGHDDHDDHGHDDHDEEGHDDHDEHGHDDHEEHGHDDHDAHGHDDHDDHGHDDHEEHGHDDHDEEGHHDHAHDGVDPHAWLDPVNAIAWTQTIADELSRQDPENAATYAKNAAEGIAALNQLSADLAADLAPAHDLHFVVFHDAYHYFENRFGLAASGAISVGDATDPSAARVAEVRDTVADAGVTCVFAEPQFNPGLIRAVSETGVKVAQIDPLGVGLELGPDLYGQTLRALSASILGCLK
jgi:zinc transport system substrate-binding protein